MNKPKFSNHHFALTVSNFERSLEFYKKLGFIELANRGLPEKNKKIAILGLNDIKLEMFWWSDAQDHPEDRETMGNNVQDIGAKHFAIKVDSIESTKEFLSKQGIPLASEPALGDTGYDFFFIRDPDGIWVEFVYDEKFQ